ncbi:hypothetical protein GCM10025881_38620 [Pseudolysinimonas kribbensis]|uniref:Pyruvate kinase n=1 Tax=Pseudolysinimonas kribbensis TaxID=433641 RepID=A0ABQ6KCK5_9MICO|nr:hypothetical protein GCM10025881_38620 [Pseudolysinimonas kribbensis]
MRRAKIVATLGPATSSYENIRAILEAGVDVARMNLSHGTYAVHEEVYANVRRAAEDLKKPVAVLVDLQGPKIRLGKFESGPYELAVGDIFTITTEDILGTKELVSTTFKGLPGDVKAGDFLLIDDGKVRVKVLDTDGVRVRTEVIVAGPVSNNKGINLPGVAVSVPALSDKDEADLRWGLKLGADYIALSFVRDASDISRVHEIMAEEGRRVPVIAKIEKPQAVDNLEEIIDAFDSIMVARGDLGVELPLEAVPIVQKRAVELARRMAKPVIVATQMLESMISSPVPTRAETSDVANAVLDGADAVMLSGETSVGEYPVVTVATMARIVASTEDHGLERIPPLGTKPRTQGARSPSRPPTSPSSSKRSSSASSRSRATPRAGCPGCATRCRCARSRPRRPSGAAWRSPGASSRTSSTGSCAPMTCSARWTRCSSARGWWPKATRSW